MSSNHQRVAHAWAHQTGRSRNGHSMFYDGATIYSYGNHFPIARLVEIEPACPPVVLFTTRSHSVTTAAHKSTVWSACSHLRRFEVGDVGEDCDHAANHGGMIRAAAEQVALAKRARSRGDFYLSLARDMLANANRYALAFGLDFAPVGLDSLGVAMADLEERLAAANAAAKECELLNHAEESGT